MIGSVQYWGYAPEINAVRKGNLAQATKEKAKEKVSKEIATIAEDFGTRPRTAPKGREKVAKKMGH